MAKFQINFLGCGSATSTLQHLPSSQILNIRDNLFMIDCGEGAQLQMRRMKLKFSRLNHIFISHLHGDHCFGLPGLVSTLGLLGKGGTLVIHIFKDGAEQFGRMFDYFCRDMPYNVEFNIITMSSSMIYEDDAITVKTIPLKHRIPAVGFLFEEKPKLRHINGELIGFYNIPRFKINEIREGKDFVTEAGIVIPNERLTLRAERAIRYAYCSDTAPAQKIIPFIEGVDCLYHEATYGNDHEMQARKRFHSTARQAAEVALKANVNELIIGHYSSRYPDNNILLEEAREIFPNTRLSNEGLQVDLL